jgi:hypothetical protein
MKTTIATLCLLACNAQAVMVESNGYGNTFESALKNAKIAAVEQVNGTWLSGQVYSNNGKISEEIAQYNGGVIKSYNVISYFNNVVTISADVDIVKDNRMASKTGDVPQFIKDDLSFMQENYSKIEKSINYLNNKNNAFGVKLDGVEYFNKGDITSLRLSGTVSWSPKWISDFESLHKTIGQKNFSQGDKLACISVRKNYIGPDQSCIATTGFTKFNDNFTITVNGISKNKSVFNKPFYFRNNMYERVYVGYVKRDPNSVDNVYQYDNATLVFHKFEKETFNVTLDVPTNDLKQVDLFKFDIM